MGLDTELTGVLRDVVQFLECLREAKLAPSLECVRSNLLIRSKDALTMLVVERLVRSSSPEPYLNMNAAKSKGLVTKVETELQEYVGAEERPEKQPQQDYYETLQTVESSNVITINGTDKDADEQTENTLLEVYANLSAAQAKSMCQMCGSLYRKEGKKLFVFEQYRAYWIGLIGSYLLIYGSDRDSRPCTILPIRGYMARAAPNAVPRDQRRSESTFEIFRPGNRTFQFVASTPKNMEQWIAKICELGSAEKTEHKALSKVVTKSESDVTHSNGQGNPERREERYQDVGSLVDNVPEEPPTVSNAKEDNSKETDSSAKETCTEIGISPPSISPVVSISPPPPPPPPLPPSPHSVNSQARIPRKLPSLPEDRSSYEFLEEEEDDIYHKIEDYRDAMRYGNLAEIRANARAREPATYDDARSARANIKNESKLEHKQRKKNSENSARKSLNLRNEATYDDTANTVTKDKNVLINEQESLVSYDDVENLASKSIKARTDKTDEVTKSPQKKSFLDRVRSKREFPKKSEKKVKCKTPTSPPPPCPAPEIDQEPPTYYDDVSDFAKAPEIKRVEEEDSEYTCPPAPRPVYVKPPVVADTVDSQEFYDDVSACREKYEKDRDTCQFDQRSPRKHSYGRDHASTDLCENVEDNEHYKIPRVDAGHPKSILIETDELYDDIAILADFTARQKEYPVKKDNEETKLQASPEKRSWNRFGKKTKTIDTVSESNRASNGLEDVTDEFNEQQSSLRMNTFQKLISRMENSLGKASVRTASSMLLNKTNVVNNA
ncbi:uncharacterized protein LOC100879848 [Megachile rotundata]|uniref:uncharacterized protein LOC100879848 n=1 Tax=Megachile rotundata TaxID=143995 RepID=UPI000614FF3C|nr:PREDICTED: uncharacterized protein LOC100879848 [Megachile rotundata]XP_012140189.1 PREDICTED: uncharacterized protein LOC100879848 [Megachile rotundata]XP_012140190.1 PREDICTED: uncharacterized protein LOC100879848 [Megachile rotundata]